MKFVLAPDSFKGSMSAADVASTMNAGIKAVFPDAECIEVPMADGGEGTMEALTGALGGTLRSVEIQDALGRPKRACFGWVESKRIAVMEVAEAVGIEHLAVEELDPRSANSIGVGQLLGQILDLEPNRLIVGLGGSATNDGGWGMAKHLGVTLVDGEGNDIETSPLALRRAEKIDLSRVDNRWADIDVVLACDVDSPLTGDTGATMVFGPQKGVKSEEIRMFEDALAQWGKLLDSAVDSPVSTRPGAGAAGGLGAAFIGVLGARTQCGVDVVTDTVDLAGKIHGADFVFTGEGSMDFQTKFGKTPWGVMLTAKKQGIPTIAFAGNLGVGAEDLQEDGFAAIIPTIRRVSTLQEAIERAEYSLFESVRTVCMTLAVARENMRNKEQK